MFESSGGKVETFEGVIIDHHRTNAWWEKDLQESGGKKFPDCFSLDGITPSEKSEKIQCDVCQNCQWDKIGSDRKGTGGKDCKNMRRLHLITQGSVLPRRLSITASAFFNFDTYMTELYDMGYPYATMVTNFSLTKGPKEGFEYSVLNFSQVKPVSTEELYVVADYIKKYKQAAQQQDVTTDEFTSKTEEDTSFNPEKFEDAPASDIPY